MTKPVVSPWVKRAGESETAYCAADCGCAGCQPAQSCRFDPSCSRCYIAPAWVRRANEKSGTLVGSLPASIRAESHTDRRVVKRDLSAMLRETLPPTPMKGW